MDERYRNTETLRLRLCINDVVNKQKEAASEESLGDGKTGYENRTQR